MKKENNLVEQQGFVAPDTALESMRASDFDTYSAYGEVVDNSIQAYATDIRIKIEERQDRQNHGNKKIGRVIFADNGTGMDLDLLHKCLKLGHSSRYNDRSGIGRFGVGMTLGAIHECRRVEVYSKIKGDNWYYTYIDLDEIKDGELKYIPFPIQKDPVFDVSNYISISGTVVVWSKYDKQVDPYEKVIKETRFWMGRTFRKFLWGEAKDYDEINITINGKKVNAFDPLFLNKSKTGFETEPKSKRLPPHLFDWNVPNSTDFNKQKSKIIIEMSLLPDEYRRKRGKGRDEFAQERFIDRNEGISILRNDREVFFGHIPNASKLNGDEADRMVSRFIGCEISFSAELDDDFSVKNIKRGAVPVRNLKKKIINDLAPTFITQRKIIRDRWDEIKRNETNIIGGTNEKIGISGTHAKTISILKENKKNLLRGDQLGKKGNNERIGRKINPKAPDINIVIEGLKENGITIDERAFVGSTFLDMEHGNGIKVLLYNTNSVFYKYYSEILEKIRSKNNEIASDYKVLMDLIFVGYMLAESKIDPNEQMDGASFIDDMKSNWALELRKILKKWKD